MKHPFQNILLLLLFLALAGCAQLSQKAESIKPTVKLADARLADINFEQADLVFGFEIENKNPVPVKLAGLDYDLKIENQSLVSGHKSSEMQIAANSTSTVELPVSLKFEDLKKLPGELKNKDRVAYNLDTTIYVDLPLIGKYPVPVSKQGELPVPRLPGIKLKDVAIQKLGFTEADVIARVEIDNPNDFNLGLHNFDYQLNVNQQSWGQGKISQSSSIPKKGKGTIDIPVRLNLLSLGQSAYAILAKKQAFEYQLKGNVTLDTGLELLRNFNMPLDIKGNAALK